VCCIFPTCVSARIHHKNGDQDRARCFLRVQVSPRCLPVFNCSDNTALSSCGTRLVDNRIYPGWGRRFVTRIGQLITTGGSKTSAMYHQRKKPALLRWTQAWRRQHKKLNTETSAKKRARKVIKVARAIVGANLDEVCFSSRHAGYGRETVAVNSAHVSLPCCSSAAQEAQGRGQEARRCSRHACRCRTRSEDCCSPCQCCRSKGKGKSCAGALFVCVTLSFYIPHRCPLLSAGTAQAAGFSKRPGRPEARWQGPVNNDAKRAVPTTQCEGLAVPTRDADGQARGFTCAPLTT
jgi:ribosomal protein L24E